MKSVIYHLSLLNKSQQFCLTVVFLYVIYLLLPINSSLFNDPYSSVILDRNEKLLSAQIAKDGQWRFPYNKTVPIKFEKAIIAFEDKRFFCHWGVDFFALCRAFYLNISHGKIVSGGSTLHMQVIRLSRKGKPRTFMEKTIEAFCAHHLHMHYSKKEVLALYASNAPFGGNVVGLDAAAWRFFGKKPKDLSWAESCMLAVLPNSPSLVHLARNRNRLKKKRNSLLFKLFKQGELSEDDYKLAIEETLPVSPKAFPMLAPHLLEKFKARHSNGIQATSILKSFQKKSADVLMRNYEKLLKPRNIHNAAIVIIDVESKEVVAYHGNIPHFSNKYNYYVNCAEAPRSTGSVLKPFLYAAMLSEGTILPHSLIADVPVNISGYSPENYSRGNSGAIPADKALARSLNIPAVLMLKKYGVHKFQEKLQKAGLTTLTMPAEHYGLSLILGGCEGTLLEITNTYASMAKSLNNFYYRNSKYCDADYSNPSFTVSNSSETAYNNYSDFSASSIWFTFNAMVSVDRPDAESNWREFSSSEKIAWKTGTSFGFRDAWAVGVTPNYAVGVWVGNASGEGMPEIIGLRVAAPILFEVFSFLPYSEFFDEPISDLAELDVCDKSGMLASSNCPPKKQFVQKRGNRSEPCGYHKLIHLDARLKARVNADCYPASQIIDSNWFVLPAGMEYYYKKKNASYQSLPKYLSGCEKYIDDYSPMEIIYPMVYTKIYIPIGFNHKKESAVFQIVHVDKDAILYWHVDDKYIGETCGEHKMPLNARKGKHMLTVYDSDGYKLTRTFEIVSK